MPNRIGNVESTLLSTYVGTGDVNEDYDAPDFQNCFLASEVATLENGIYKVAVLPSFHRPALVSDQGIGTRTVFRPLPGTHPDFPPLKGLGSKTNEHGLGDSVGGSRVFEWDAIHVLF